MVYQALSVQTTGHVAIITLKGPADGPSKRWRLSDELLECADTIRESEKIRVVIVTDAGEGSFSLETDTVEPDQEGDEEETTRNCSLASPIAGLEMPTLAAIQGDAIGQGLELVLACDLRIGAETAHFGFSQIKKGRIPQDGGTQRLARLVGRGKTIEMILTGELIDAQEALRIGLLNKVVPSESLAAVALKMAQEIGSKAPIATEYAKEAITKGMDMTLEQGLRLEADLYLLLHTTKDRTKGIKAFREKRTPKFQGK
jgi:enoyl-CoA hydratase/carnithine racemase